MLCFSFLVIGLPLMIVLISMYHQYCLQTVVINQFKKYSKLVFLSLGKKKICLLDVSSFETNVVRQLSEYYFWTKKKKHYSLMNHQPFLDYLENGVTSNQAYDLVFISPKKNHLIKLPTLCRDITNYSSFLCILIPTIYGWNSIEELGLRVLERKPILDPYFHQPIFQLYFCQIKK